MDGIASSLVFLLEEHKPSKEGSVLIASNLDVTWELLMTASFQDSPRLALPKSTEVGSNNCGFSSLLVDFGTH